MYIGLQRSKRSVITVEWKTASELNTAGFNLYRSDQLDGPYFQVNQGLIPASPDPLVGGVYTYRDETVIPGAKYYYRLEDIDFDGGSSRFGPIEIEAKPGGRTEFILAGLCAIIAAVFTWVFSTSPKRQANDSQ